MLWSHGLIFLPGNNLFPQNNAYSTSEKVWITSISWLTTAISVYLGISADRDYEEHRRLQDLRSTFYITPTDNGAMASWGFSF